MEFGRKKGKDNKQIKQKEYLCKGVSLNAPIQFEHANEWWNCLIKGFMVFLVSFGCIGAFLSSFGMKFYLIPCGGIFLAISLYFAALYYKNWIRDIGYIIFFILYAFLVYGLRTYINSGYHAVANIIFECIENYFNLPGMQYYEEQIANQSLAITVFAVFVGTVEIILINLAVSNRMSLFLTVCGSFPVLLFPLYFRQEPDAFYVFLLLSGYASIAALHANKRTFGTISQMLFGSDSEKRYRKKNKTDYYVGKKNGEKQYIYFQDGKMIGQIIAFFLVCTVVLLGTVNIAAPEEKYQASYQESALKGATTETVRRFILTGPTGFFNFYSSTGGMSHGRLGGVSSVRNDYQTDLIVTFTPYSYDAVYLKGFTGISYTPNAAMWTTATARQDEAAKEIKTEAQRLAEAFLQEAEGSGQGRMDVTNADASTSYLYAPYYTTTVTMAGEETSVQYLDHQVLNGTLQLGETASYTYYPIQGNVEKPGEPDKVYLEVPEENYEVIKTFCEEAGFGGSDEEIINQVIGYFQENFSYTTKPGATPRKQDFVNYFLTRNRQGYCAHFATAATLIFRYYGIPARYIEGYAFTYDDVLSGDIEAESYEDYFQGENSLGETAVVSVQVTDAQAHAWVEVYDENFGWRVVEVTPSSTETEEENTDFWSIFSGLLSDTPDLDSAQVERQQAGTVVDMKHVGRALLGFFAVAFFLFFGRIMYGKIKRIKSYHTKDTGENLVAYYQYLCGLLRVANGEFRRCMNHKEQLGFIETVYGLELDYQGLISTLEGVSYGPVKISKEEYEEVKTKLNTIRKAVLKNARFHMVYFKLRLK